MKFKIIRQLRCSFKHYILILFRNLGWLIASFLFPAIICFLLFRLKSNYESNIKEPFTCSSKQNFLIQSPSWSKPAFEELFCPSKATCNGSENQFYRSKSSPNYQFTLEENKNPSIWTSEEDELFSLLMIDNERQLFSKIFEKWSKLKEIFSIFEKPSLNQFLDSEISLKSIVKDEIFTTNLLKNEKILKIFTQNQNKNNVSANFSIRKIFFNEKKLEEELCSDSFFDEATSNLVPRTLLNCLCELPYEEAKKVFIVLKKKLNWNKIYKKAEELDSMERQHEWTEREERIFSNLKGSLLKLSSLRSLSKVFLSLESVLEDLENPRKILKDSGWKSDQIQRLLGYLIELGDEKSFREIFNYFLEDQNLFGEMKGQDLINTQKKKKENPNLATIVLINMFLKEISGRNSCEDKKIYSSSLINNSINLLNLSNQMFSDLEKRSSEDQQNVTFMNDKEKNIRNYSSCHEELVKNSFALDEFRDSETRIFDKCSGGKIVRNFLTHFTQQNSKNFWDEFYSLISGDASEEIKFKRTFSNWIEIFLNSETLLDSFTGLKRGKIFLKKFLTTLNETLSIIEESFKREKVKTIPNTLSVRVLELTADEAVDLVEEFLIRKSAGFVTGRNYVSPDCHDASNRSKVCPTEMFSNLFDVSSPFFDKIFQISSLGNETPNVQEILCRLLRVRNLLTDLSQHSLTPEIIQKFVDNWQKEYFDIFEEKFSKNQSFWIYRLGDTIWKNFENFELLTFMETIMNLFINFDHLITELISAKDFFLNDSWLNLFEIIHRHLFKNENETLTSMSTLVELCKMHEKSSATPESESDENRFLCTFNSADFQRNLLRLKTSLVNNERKMVPEIISTYELWNSSQTFFEKLNYLQLLRSSQALNSRSSFSAKFETLFQEGNDTNFLDFTSEIFISSLQENILSQEFLYHIYIFNNILGDSSEEMFKDFPVFNKLKKTINQEVASALQEFVLLIKTKPRLIHILHQPLKEGRSLCQVDISSFGEVINKVLHYFCHFPLQELDDELKSLTNYSNFVQEGRENISINELSKFILHLNKPITWKKGKSNSEESFPFSNWIGIFPSVLNVTMEEIYENGSRIWAEMMSPLVMESRKERPKSEKLRDILKSLNGYLRQLKLSLKLVSGGDIWTSVKDCYQDKPLVLEVIELVEEAPDIVNELLILYDSGNYTVNKLISSSKSISDFCLFHFDLFSRDKRQKSSTIFKAQKIFDLFCDESSRSLIFDQLEPKSLPIIANMTMEPDAAILGLLLDTVTWDLFLLQKGFFIEKHLQIPDWLRPFRWKEASKNFIQLFSKTFVEHMTNSFEVKREEISTKSNSSHFQKQFLKSLRVVELWIEDMRDKNENVNKKYLLKEFSSFVLWVTQTKSYYELLSGLPVEDVISELCEGSVVNLSQESYENDSDFRVNELFLCEMSKVLFYADNETSEVNEGRDITNVNWVADPSLTEITFNNIIGSFLEINSVLSENSKKMKNNDLVSDVLKFLVITILNYESNESPEEKTMVLNKLKYINHFIDIYINKGKISNNEEKSVERTIKEILRSLPLKIKGGKWTNNAEEILKENLIFEKKFELFFDKVKKDIGILLNCTSSDSPSCSNFKLFSGLSEALTEFYLIMKTEKAKDSFSQLLNATKEQERSVLTLHQMLQPLSKDAFEWDDDKEYLIILSSLISNSSKVVRILNASDHNLESIVEILLTFSEVLNDLDMNQITFQNFTSHKNFRSNFYLLQNLKKSVAGVRSLINNEILSETHLGKHLENIHSGINMFLNKTLSRKRILQHVYLNEFVEREEDLAELESLLRENSCFKSEEAGNRGYEVPFYQLAAFYKNWWQKLQKHCNRNENLKVDGEEEKSEILEVFCYLSSRNDSIKILLEQVDVSQVFLEVEKNLLHETLNKRKISEVEVQENYVKFNYEMEGLYQLKNLSQFLLRISSFNESNVFKTDEELIQNSSKGFVHQLQKQYCSKSQTIREIGEDITTQELKEKSDNADMCSAFDELSFAERNVIPNLLLNAQIYIVPKNEMTLKLGIMMNKTFEEVVDKVKFVNKLKTLIDEGCFGLMQNISGAENFLRSLHWFTSAFYSSLAIDLNLLNRHIQTYQSLCYDFQTNKEILIPILDSIFKWFSCFNVKNRIQVLNKADLQSQILLSKSDNDSNINFVFFGNDSSNFSPKDENLNGDSELLESKINYNISSKTSEKENQNANTIKQHLHIQAMVERFLSQQTKNTDSLSGGFEPQNNSKILGKTLTRTRRDNFESETLFSLEKYDVLAVPVNYSCNGMEREFYFGLKSSAEFISVFIVFLFGIFFSFSTITFSSSIHSVSHEVKILHSFPKWIISLPLLTSSLIMVIVQSSLSTLFLKSFGVFARSEFILLFVVFFLFGLNIMRISYFVATWRSSKCESVLLTQSIVILSLIPFWYTCTNGLSETYSPKIISIFFPSSCFAFVLRTLLRFELFGIGASFSLLGILPPAQDEDLTLFISILFLFLNFLLLNLIFFIWTLGGKDSIMKLARMFPFMSPPSVQKNILNIFQERKGSIEKALSGETLKTVEAIALQKLFSVNGKPFLFGENLSFEMFENQVHVFYGPPKSGKTTILSMIAGISQPSSGYISVCGFNPVASTKGNFQTVSFCPSEASIAGDLTVYETFYYFSLLKSEEQATENAKEEAQSMICNLGLNDWKSKRMSSVPKDLQKLVSVGVSLTGSSKVVLLDEPSKGVHSSLLRPVWKLISKLKKDRTFIITSKETFEMENLADTIGLLKEGNLIYSGSVQSLMSEFSPGYNILVYNRLDIRTIFNGDQRICELEEYFQEYFPRTSFKSFGKENFEITFRLPYNDVQNSPEKLCLLFRELEMRTEELGVSYTRVCHPRLKSVLQFALDGKKKSFNFWQSENEYDLQLNFNLPERTSKWFPFSNLLTLFRKRYLHNIRQKCLMFQYFSIPFVFFIIGTTLFWISKHISTIDHSKDFQKAASLDIRNGFFAFPSNFPDWSEYERNLEKYLTTDNEAESTLGSEQIGQCDMNTINNNFIFKDSSVCFVSNDKVNLTDCVCHNDNCILKMNFGLHNLVIPFNMKYFKIIYMNLWLQLRNLKDSIVIGYDFSEEESLFRMTNVMRRANVKTMKHFEPWIVITNSNDEKKNVELFVTLGTLSILMGVSFAVLLTTFQVVRQRVNEDHFLILSKGVSKFIYWASNFLWDTGITVLCGFLVLVAIIPYQFSFELNIKTITSIFLLTVLYGWSLQSAIYVSSIFYIKNKNNFMSKHLLFSAVVGLLSNLIVIVCEELCAKTNSDRITIGIHYVFHLIPQYVYTKGVATLIKNSLQLQKEREEIDSYFIALLLWIGICLVILSFLEEKENIFHRLILKRRASLTANEAIEKETFANSNLSLIVSALQFHVPHNVGSESIRLDLYACKNESLTIVGMNARERKKFVRYLIGDIRPPSESLLLVAEERHRNYVVEKGLIGYCPQTPALDSELTVEEELKFELQLQGFIETTSVHQKVQEMILKLDLNHFKNKFIKYLDKDVKRRVSLAKAVIGGPKILLIDDSHEDNVFQCRKTLRSVIRSACTKDCTVIILSKSYEEAEFLSERLATFEGGRIVHIGNIKAQDESSNGRYIVKIKAEKIQDISQITKIIKQEIQEFTIIEKYDTKMVADTSSEVTPYLIFGAISKARKIASFWYEVTSIFLPQYYQQLGLHPSRHSSYSSTNNSLMNEIPNVIFTEDDSCSSLTFPVFDKPRSQRDSLYDNVQGETSNDNLNQCHRRTLSNRMRRGSGGSKLTPCSTPQPPRTPPEVQQQYKQKLKSLEDLHHPSDRNPHASFMTPATFKESKANFPSISQRSSDSINKDTIVEDYLKKQNETTGSRGMIDRFIENLPNVKINEDPQDLRNYSISSEENVFESSNEETTYF